MSTLLEAGSELAGYRVERVLGQGGMGVVYLARDLRLERPVALKVVRAELAGDARFRDWFLQESQLAAGLDHPSIVPVYGAGEDRGVLYLAMRYVDGRSLRDVLKDEGALRPDRALRIVRQLAAALDAAHAAGMVHRDVKPANVLLTGDPTERTEHAYLADFGLAKRPATADSVTGSGALLGTISYAAPEQIEGAQVDGRADIYSLGCLTFECLTGRPPFSADSDLAVVYAHLQQPPPTISSVGRNLPPALDPVIAKALAKKPADRYRTARELVNAAAAAFPGSPRARRSRRPLVAAAGMAVTGVAALGVAGILADRTHAGHDATAGPRGDQLLALDARTGRIVRRTALPEGSAPVDVAVSAGMAYVADSGTDTISQIDAETGSTVHNISAPGLVGFATGDGTVRAVIQDARGVSLHLVDGTVGQLTRTVQLPQPPGGWIALTSGWAWFPTTDGKPFGGFMRAATDGSGRTEDVPLGPNGAVTPVIPDGDGALLLAARLPDGMQERVLRAGANRHVTSLGSMAHLGDPFGSNSEALAATPDAIYSLGADGTVWKFDRDGHGIVASRNVGAGVWTTLAARRSGVWVGDVAHGAVLRLDPTTLVPRNRVILPGAPNAIWSDGNALYVAATPIRAAAQPASGAAARGTLRIVADGDINDWDGTDFDGLAWNVESVMCNALLDYRSTPDPRRQADLIPGVAESLPHVSADRRTYTFQIRRGLLFSDGTPVTPADVVGTYLRGLSPRADFEIRTMNGYFDDIVGARAYEEGKARTISGITSQGQQVRFRLKHPDPTFPYRTAMRLACIVPGDTRRAHYQKAPPMTGPFVVASRTLNRSLVLVPNPVWPHNQRILGEPSPRGVHRIEITFGMAPAAQLAAIASGRADLSLGDDVFRVASARRLLAEQQQAGHVAAASGGGFTYLALNVRHGPFSNVAVRRAANLAVDRTRIATVFSLPTSRPWAEYLPSSLATSASQPYPPHADIPAALRQLQRSGLRLPIPVSLWYFSPKTEVAPVVAEVKRDMDAAGFAVTLRPIWGPWFGADSATLRKEADMEFAGWGEDYPDADTVIPALFQTGSDYNAFGYSSNLVDREIRRLQHAPDTEGRRAAWSNLAVRIARRDVPIVVLGDQQTTRLHSARLHNVVINAAKTGPDLSLLQLGP